ncbi:MAG: hypothetical protein Q8Q04_01610 [archaeon]|nr:hypothetical protein [archaeon]
MTHLYISHSVMEKNSGDSSRLKQILREGIKSSFNTGEKNALKCDMEETEIIHNDKFNFLYAFPFPNKFAFWAKNSPLVSGVFYLSNEYVLSNAQNFFNGSCKDPYGKIFTNGGFDKDSNKDNSESFIDFCKENKIDSHKFFNKIARIPNQIVSYNLPVEALESLLVFDEKILEEVKNIVPKNIDISIYDEWDDDFN